MKVDVYKRELMSADITQLCRLQLLEHEDETDDYLYNIRFNHSIKIKHLVEMIPKVRRSYGSIHFRIHKTPREDKSDLFNDCYYNRVAGLRIRYDDHAYVTLGKYAKGSIEYDPVDYHRFEDILEMKVTRARLMVKKDTPVYNINKVDWVILVTTFNQTKEEKDNENMERIH